MEKVYHIGADYHKKNKLECELRYTGLGYTSESGSKNQTENAEFSGKVTLFVKK